jgi:hypothetical protein
MSGCGVRQVDLFVHAVDVSASRPGPREIAGVDEIGHDPLHGSLGDPHPVRDVTQADLWVLGDGQQDEPVARDEGP